MTVHPHVRGEHFETMPTEETKGGSSPRPWGTHKARQYRTNDDRFIPTSVGNTEDLSVPPCSGPVHPHVRGEHASDLAAGLAGIGSSPRPWGTLLVHEELVLFERFIPTSVGNTLSASIPWLQQPVHPHVRGEHMSPSCSACFQNGSSPRPWGTPLPPQDRMLSARFIPTSVGNTSHG